MKVDEVNRETREVIISLVKQVKTVRIMSCSFATPVDFFAVLSNLRKPVAVHLVNPLFTRSNLGPTTRLPVDSFAPQTVPLAELHVGILTIYFATLFTDWILHTCQEQVLRRLNWCDPFPAFGTLGPGPDRILPLLKLVDTAGPMLEHLELAFENESNGGWVYVLQQLAADILSEQVHRLDLSKNTHLAVLDINHATRVTSVQPLTRTCSCEWLPTLLSSVKSTHLRHLNLYFDLIPDQDGGIVLDFLEWDRVDEVLVSLRQLAPQVAIVFHFRGRLEGEFFVTDIIQAFGNLFPQAQEAGVPLGVRYTFPAINPLVGQVRETQEAWLISVSPSIVVERC